MARLTALFLCRHPSPKPCRKSPRPPDSRAAEPFDDPAWGFELKFDGFRCIADTLDQRLVSKHQNRMKRFEPLLGTLPYGYVFDGEIVYLDETGRSIFNDLLFRNA